MLQKCQICDVIQIKSECKALNCQKHFICNKCLPKNPQSHCEQCQIIISQQSSESERNLRNYPIQGIMVNYHDLYNPQGQSQFSSRRNCFQRTNGWILCNFLAIVFFFSGLAVAIKTSQIASGVIMVILGAVGMFASVYFICKVRKVDKYFEREHHLNQENFIWLKQQRNDKKTISSARTQRD